MAIALLIMLAIPAFAQDGKTGAGDDQQVPDNQQTGGGKDTVTKTFEFTLTGEAPEGTSFFTVFVESPTEGTPVAFLVFCGDPGLESVGVEPEAACEAGVFTRSVEIAAGTTIEFDFVRKDPETAGEVFQEGTETLDADMTNTAFFTFGTGADDDQQDTGGGKDTGAGDVQQVPDNQQDTEDKDTDTGTGAGDDQQNAEDKDTGAGDDQQVPDNQQDGEDKDTGAGAGDEQQDNTQGGEDTDTVTGAGDDQQDDAQDDQQGEMPEELPETGVGGLSPSATIPVGNAAAGLTMLIGAGYAVLRRR